MTRWLTDDEQRHWRAWLAASLLLNDRLSRDLQEQHGLTIADYEILVHLSEAPDRRLRMSELAEAALSSRSRLSHQIDRMARAGLVDRESCADDRRGAFAVLTQHGWDVLVAAAPDHVESVRRHPIAPGAVRQGLQADVLTINETAQFARGVQFRRIGDIDGQTALGRRRGRRIPFPAGIEDQGDHHGRDDRQAGTDGDENSIVLGHERLAGMRPPITLPGAPASTFFVARRPSL